MWWRNVLIGSLKFTTWSPINETLTFHQITKVLHANPVTYLLVLKTLNPLEVIGVVLAEDVEKMKLAKNQDEIGNIPVVQVKGLVRKDCIMLPIENNAVGDVEKALEEGAKAVVLHRTTRELKLLEGEDIMVERMHPISIVTEVELKNWIQSVEEHHNIS